jgi:hypothetical protein
MNISIRDVPPHYTARITAADFADEASINVSTFGRRLAAIRADRDLTKAEGAK